MPCQIINQAGTSSPRSRLLVTMDPFPKINRAFNQTFREGALTLGLVVPLEAHRNDPVPTLERHIERA